MEKSEGLSTKELAEKLKEFEGELGNACEVAKGGDPMPLQNLLSYTDLEGYETEMVETLLKHFGIKLAKPRIANGYSIYGEPGTPGEGMIKVTVFATNEPGVFLGKYEHADGVTIDWTIRPLWVKE